MSAISLGDGTTAGLLVSAGRGKDLRPECSQIRGHISGTWTLVVAVQDYFPDY